MDDRKDGVEELVEEYERLVWDLDEERVAEYLVLIPSEQAAAAHGEVVLSRLLFAARPRASEDLRQSVWRKLTDGIQDLLVLGKEASGVVPTDRDTVELAFHMLPGTEVRTIRLRFERKKKAMGAEPGAAATEELLYSLAAE